MVGNLYSRVGTEDWVPHTADQQSFNKLINDQLRSCFQVIPNLTEIDKILKRNFSPEELDAMSVEKLLTQIKSTKIPTRKEKVLHRLQELITESNSLKEGFAINKLMARIVNDASITAFLK